MGVPGRDRGFWTWVSPTGLKVLLHWSSLPFVLGLGWLHASQFAKADPSASPARRWTWAVLGGMMPLVSMAAHEVGHLLAARAIGLAPRAIVLTPVAAGTVVPQDPPSPRKEATFAVAGPLASILAAAGVALVSPLLPHGPARALARLFVRLNLALGASNLLPSLPLDGGLLARSLRWYTTGDRTRATRDSEVIGQGIGLALTALGLLKRGRPVGAALLLAGLTALLGAAAARRMGPDPFGVLERR